MQVIETMTSRERVLAALRGDAVDRTPVINPTSVATVELMDLVDARFPDANRDPELMAALAATGHTELGFDSIMPVFSIIQESSALGARIQWEQKDNWPTVKMTEPIYHDPEDIEIRPDVLEHPDTQCVLEAIRILRRRFGDEVAIIGKSMGPWSLAYHTFGVENFLLMSNDDEARTRRVLDNLKELTIEYANMQFEAGADAITLPDHATGDLVSGEYYHRYLEEMHREFAQRIDGPIILHICGRTVDRMRVHRQDRHGRVPLRLQERTRRVDGGGRRPHSAGRQRQQPADPLLEGTRGGQGGGVRQPRRGGADGRAGVRDARCRPRSRTSARFARP